MDEHEALVDESDHVRRALAADVPLRARTLLTGLVSRLDRHVRREEDGIFRALRQAGEFVDEVDELEGEHRDLSASIAALDPGSPGFVEAVTHLLDDLDAHIVREDYGVFPVSVVTLGARGWALVDRAHAESPSFLLDASAEPQPPQEEEGTCRRSH